MWGGFISQGWTRCQEKKNSVENYLECCENYGLLGIRFLFAIVVSVIGESGKYEGLVLKGGGDMLLGKTVFLKFFFLLENVLKTC